MRAVVCALVVLALVGQAASRLDVLSARRTAKDRLLARRAVELEHRTLDEVMRELQVSARASPVREKRIRTSDEATYRFFFLYRFVFKGWTVTNSYFVEYCLPD